MKKFRMRGMLVAVVALILAVTAAAEPPKYVFVMIGDGMGFNNVLAADYYQFGEAGKQVYEGLGFVKLAVSTYPHGGSYDPQAAASDPKYVLRGCTDSAAAATALSAGAKTKNGHLGVGPGVERLETMTDFMQAHQRRVGLVTTVPITHATPAGFAAHQVSRNHYTEIAKEILLESPVRVLMGGGHPFFGDDGAPYEAEDEDDRYEFVGGKETWDLISDPARSAWKRIEAREEFQALAEKADPTMRVAGIMRSHSTSQVARPGHDDNIKDDAPYETPRREDVPSLAEMSKAAINTLNDGTGFFLMVEGGAIDWAGHKQAFGRMIEEMADFNEAIEAVVEWVNKESNWNDTLLIITADHETGRLLGPDGVHDIESAGKGVMPKGAFKTSGHTNNLVPLFVRGNGAEVFKARATKQDPVRGAYLDNTDVANAIHDLWK